MSDNNSENFEKSLIKKEDLIDGAFYLCKRFNKPIILKYSSKGFKALYFMNMANSWKKANIGYITRAQDIENQYNRNLLELKQINLFDHISKEKYDEDWIIAEIL